MWRWGPALTILDAYTVLGSSKLNTNEFENRYATTKSMLISNSTPNSQITADAIAIWQAGVDAVRADNIVRSQVFADKRTISIDDREWMLDRNGRLIVIGAGKAAFMMTKGLLQVVEGIDPAIEIVGWINVPEGTAIESLDPRVHVCEARPQGVNEPTPKVLDGTRRIVELVQSARPIDTVVFLLTGGGSALLSWPIECVTLEEKLAVIRHLSHSGANIEELNSVRRSLSQVKGGGLVRGCRAGNWITLVISDVLGDPLEAIASGPTVLGLKNDPSHVCKLLMRFDPDKTAIPPSVYRVLEAEGTDSAPHSRSLSRKSGRGAGVVPDNIVLANNATAVDAAGVEAVRRGYAYWMQSSRTCEGAAEEVGRSLARQVLGLVDQPKIQCLISGGEPSVVLPPSDRRGKGGRNQQLVLAAWTSF